VKGTPLDGHLDAFELSLSDNSPKYVALTMSQVRRVVAGAGFETLGDLDAEAVQAFLRQCRKDDGIGHRTYNLYLQAMGAFCNWCVSTKRLTKNPLAGIERLNTAVDVRHARRALSADEVSKLVASARSSGISIQRYNGEQRARIYLLSYLTGLMLSSFRNAPRVQRRKRTVQSRTPRCTGAAFQAALGVIRCRRMATLHRISNAKTPAIARVLALNVSDRHSMAKSGRQDLNLRPHASKPAVSLAPAELHPDD
jgi:hypothetical protein